MYIYVQDMDRGHPIEGSVEIPASGKLAGRANWSGRGHPIEGSVEIPAKWQTGRYSQSESSGTEGLGSGPVWERVVR